MPGVRQLGSSNVKEGALLRSVAVALAVALALVFTLPAAAQYPGPPARTTINGHFLGPAPSVTSLAGRYLPPPLPSVTSIPNYGYAQWYPNAPYYNGSYRGRGNGYGRNGYGYSYAVPYYIPMDGYGYDYVGGPDVYSGPPIGPDPMMHMVVEQPPVRYPYAEPDAAQAPPGYAPPRAPDQQPAAVHDAKPNEPSVLVFRDGHRQEVSNYAIMGQTVYVFDKGARKIALADLDVAATVKANDDRGLEFNIPQQKPAPKKSDLELKVAPDQKTQPPPENIASVAP
jgi:hypothetical protein